MDLGTKLVDGHAADLPPGSGVESGPNCLRVKMPGFWTPAAIAAFIVLLTRAASAWRRTHGAMRMLVDLQSHDVQSPAAFEALKGIDGRFADRDGDRIALVTASMLVKMQAERTRATPRMRIFTREEDATDWLGTDD